MMIQSEHSPSSEADALDRVEALVGQLDYTGAERFLNTLEIATRMRLLSRMAPELQQILVTNLNTEQAADILHELPDVQVTDLLVDIEPGQAAEILEEMPKDEQADLVGDMDAASREAILDEMPDAEAAAVRALVKYDDEAAGGIMVVEFLSFNQHESVRDVINYLRAHASELSDFDVQYAYIVDADMKLTGVLRFRDLLLAPDHASISTVMIADPLSVTTETTLPKLHALFVDNRYVGLPVINSTGQLVGVLRRGDVEEAMAEAYADDFLKTQGIVTEELRTMPTLLRSRRRLSWLSINIVLNIIAASVIAMYQGTLEQVIALAVFLPIISDMSGCSGNQAVAVSMRELSLGLVGAREVMRVWLKEISVGLINGLALGLLIATAAILWKGNPWLGAIVGIALMINTMIAVSLGGTLPLVMRLLKLDPALASGPILTTVTDMCGFLLVLGGATLVLDRLV